MPESKPLGRSAWSRKPSCSCPPKRVHRVNVNFSEAAWIELQTLAAVKGKTVSEVLRDALGLEKWFQDVIDSGGRVLVERNGSAREVIPR